MPAIRWRTVRIRVVALDVLDDQVAQRDVAPPTSHSTARPGRRLVDFGVAALLPMPRSMLRREKSANLTSSVPAAVLEPMVALSAFQRDRRAARAITARRANRSRGRPTIEAIIAILRQRCNSTNEPFVQIQDSVVPVCVPDAPRQCALRTRRLERSSLGNPGFNRTFVRVPLSRTGSCSRNEGWLTPVSPERLFARDRREGVSLSVRRRVSRFGS